MRKVSWIAVIVGLVTLIGGSTAADAASPAGTGPWRHNRGAPHVMTIMMENTDFSQAIGSAAMPYLNELAHQYAAFPQAYGWSYPSLPNYMELLAGSTLGISSDCDPGDPGCTDLSHETFTDQLQAVGISWHAYFQDDVSGCDDNPSDFFSGNYDVEHNPFAYLAEFPQICGHLSNFSPLLSDLRGRGAADYNWVVPDLDNDGGDNGTMSSGDTWLADAVPQMMDTPWYRHGGQIVIIYDTGYGNSGGFNGSSGGRIPPIIVISSHTRGMGLRPLPLNTAGLLRSLDRVYGLSYLGDAADPNNGSLGNALIAGRPTGHRGRALYAGAVVGAGSRAVRVVPGSLALEGVARDPAGPLVEVGESRDGQGVVVTGGRWAVPVPGTTNLESVSCPAAGICWAVGLGPQNSDQATLVKIVDGRPASVQEVPTFYGLYGIDCPAAETCEAVGYDTSDIADAVTTITNGVPGAPVEVAGGGEWLNAISCPIATVCDATGLVNYTASVVPIDNGIPQTPITIPQAWYLNGIDCPSADECTVVGESGNSGEGFLDTVAAGVPGAGQLVPGTEYLYGVGCVAGGDCLVSGASQVGVSGYSHGVLLHDTDGDLGALSPVVLANGLGQVSCAATAQSCVTVGAAATGHESFRVAAS